MRSGVSAEKRRERDERHLPFREKAKPRLTSVETKRRIIMWLRKEEYL